MKKVYPAEWVSRHPYMQSDETDRYYAGLASQIGEMLCSKEIPDDIPAPAAREAGMLVAGWFEDIISETGIWQAFTTECKQRYGEFLPFYPIGSDYLQGEVNEEDIRFLLWHGLQTISQDGTVYNPENPGIAYAASRIYELLEKEYETAPANERLHDFLYGDSRGQDDFYLYRAKLEWFHLHSYFNPQNIAWLAANCENMAEEGEWDWECDPGMVLYDIKIWQMFRGRLGLLGFTSPEWLARAGRGKPGTEAWQEVRMHPGHFFLYLRQDAGAVYLKDLTGTDGEVLEVRKASLGDDAKTGQWVAGRDVVSCRLVAYGGRWWQNGLMAVLPEGRGRQEEEMQQERDQRSHVHERAVFQAFRKASGGKAFVICRDKEDLRGFLTRKLGYKLQENLALPQTLDGRTGIVVTASPEGGLSFVPKGAECIASPDNPYYNKEKAGSDAIALCIGDKAITYELSCWLQDRKLIPDARLNSLKGEEHGRKLVRDNHQFLTDYFFHKNRTKDYPEDF